MQSFGLVGLLIVMVLAAWWFFAAGPVVPTEVGGVATSSESNILDKAHKTANEMEQSTLEHSSLK